MWEKWSQMWQAEKSNRKNSGWLNIYFVINIGADLPIYTIGKAKLNNLWHFYTTLQKWIEKPFQMWNCLLWYTLW